MNTNTALTANLNATEVFDRLATRPEWLGFGYLGGRADQPTERRVAADALLLDMAVEAGLTEDELLAWANSRPGRWAADVVFGGAPIEAAARDLRRWHLAPAAYDHGTGRRFELEG